MNNIYIPAWHYRAPGIAQRTWGWSPVEEMILLSLDQSPGTINDVSQTLKIPRQVVSSTVARLMQFGLIEVRMSPQPVLSASSVGRDFIRTGRALPERTVDREIGVSVVYEKVGLSVFRTRDVDTIPVTRLPSNGAIITFPEGEPPETHYSMMQRVNEFMVGRLRPGEWLRGVQANSSFLEARFLVLDLDEVAAGVVPPGASDQLVDALNGTIKTGVLPSTTTPPPERPVTIETSFDADQLVVGAEQHLQRFEQIVGAAKSNIFVLSTFVASLSDEKGRDRRERIVRALEDACRRGVRCHLFFGTSLDRAKHATAMQELYLRLSAARQTRGYLLVQRDPVDSHAKFLVADNGHDGAVVLMGSCNWLHSPFSAVEVSAELTEANSVAEGLDLLREIVSKLSSASRSVEALQFMASELRRQRSPLSIPEDTEAPSATLTILHAADHERLLRVAAHDAGQRFVCCTNKVGANMVPALFDPAEIAGRRLSDVRIYYSRRSGPVKRGHVTKHRERLHGIVELTGVPQPQLHAKFLAWDSDNVVVSSLNWGSQSGLEDNPLDEIGLYLEGADLATSLLEKFEAELG
ncbi:phospholipase D-like domain-containing protein [Chelativorans intermedius]|uniref:Phospholipase D-like domain-containing protein n=1 Tax=Chelativorans intermedius TaxID=515947 RepID=A0ABV6DBP5_9HYPH|nr:phospholipase D-like domain-containing protein [Chelativorans intermedius]MCT9000448.1 phospholipase D-like domain-containing protein [Chelativorans intermedius]